ncbi:MAG: serine hydrolase domain-containing protein [Dehalococcoidia bacterium]
MPAFAELDNLIESEMERAHAPGLAIALVRGDEIAWSQGYGYADLNAKTPFTRETRFSAQSVAKPVIATGLMQWRERGRFQLDGPVSQYLAPLDLRNAWEETEPVTVRHLLTHSAGLPVEQGVASPEEGGPATLEEFVALVAKTVRPPGDEIVYSNFGYDTAGYLIERFSGDLCPDYVREHVLEPLEMRSSCFGSPPEGVAPARPYFWSVIDETHHEGRHDYEVGPTFRPTWGLLSTVEDLGRFLIAHMNGGEYRGQRILRAESVAEMHRVHARVSPSGGMGLGFRVESREGRTLICHGGDGVGATIFVGAYPDEKVGVALMLNLGRAYSARSVIGDAALRLLLGESLEDEAIAGGAGPVHFTGRYRSNFWGHDAIVRGESGVVTVVVDDSPGHLSRLDPAGEGVFRAVGGFFAGAELTFEADDEDNVASFSGGLYPWRFDRTGDVPPPVQVDESADARGRWEGTLVSPYGPLPAVLVVSDSLSATVSALSAQDVPLRDFDVDQGRIEGWFDMAAPGVGETRVLLRLVVAGGRLQGKAYARGPFGEIAMPMELERE